MNWFQVISSWEDTSYPHAVKECIIITFIQYFLIMPTCENWWKWDFSIREEAEEDTEMMAIDPHGVKITK